MISKAIYMSHYIWSGYTRVLGFFAMHVWYLEQCFLYEVSDKPPLIVITQNLILGIQTNSPVTD